jgi:hypothetical protein
MATTKTQQTTKQQELTEKDIVTFSEGSLTVHLLGTSGLWINRMSKKARESLLMGSKRDRLELKHDMYEEYRSSYIEAEPDAPTALAFLGDAFKGAVVEVAADMPAVTKASIERLVSVPDERIALYGKPYLRASVVRCADRNQTPDIRTRTFLPRWAAEVTFDYVQPKFKMATVLTLIGNAGLTIGVGDWRREKGGRFGGWRVVDPADTDYQEVLAEAREVQAAAIRNPEPYDAETRELLEYFDVASRAWVIEQQEKARKAEARKAKKAAVASTALASASDGNGAGAVR